MHRFQVTGGTSNDTDLSSLVHLHETGMKCAMEGDVSELLEELLDDVIAATGADFGNVQLLDHRTRELRIAAHRGLPHAFVEFFDSVAEGEAACGSAIGTGARVIVEDVHTSPLYSEEARQTMLDACAVACQSTLLVSRGGAPLGVVSTHFRKPRRPSASELQKVDRLVRHTADFVECVRLRQSLEEACARERAARELAEAANRSKDRFLATLAHELRQPLSAVFPAIELQRRGHGLERHATDVMERQLWHLSRLIEDLSDASRISRGEIDLTRERIDLRAAIQQAVDMTAPLFQGKHQQPAIDLGTDPVWIAGDRTRLTQVFSNLLRNACLYTPEHGLILAALETRGGQVTFTLRDNGLGIPPEALGRIFEIFDRGSPPHDSPGVGIGLAVVRHLVELHGGTVCATSDGPGRGSEFVVTLPAADGPPDHDAADKRAL